MTILQNLRDWRAYRRAYAELNRLPTERLHDMGVPRWRVKEIARSGRTMPELTV